MGAVFGRLGCGLRYHAELCRQRAGSRTGAGPWHPSGGLGSLADAPGFPVRIRACRSRRSEPEAERDRDVGDCAHAGGRGGNQASRCEGEITVGWPAKGLKFVERSKKLTPSLRFRKLTTR